MDATPATRRPGGVKSRVAGLGRAAGRLGQRLDVYQQRTRPLAFTVGVVRKYGDDNGRHLMALITYYAFLSVFPLLLLLVTVLGLVAGSSSSATRRIEHSALAQFPVIGNQLGQNIHQLHDRSLVGLAIGLVGLLYGSQRASRAGQFAMAEIWSIPPAERPGAVARLGRSLLLIGAIGLSLLVSTGLAGLSGFSGTGPAVVRLGLTLLTLVANVGLFVLAFRLLTPKVVGLRRLVPGAVAGGIGWTGLQLVGAVVVDHTLRHTSQVYGFFAVILGLLFWIGLGTKLTLYCAEANVVLHRRLWPRTLRRPRAE